MVIAVLGFFLMQQIASGLLRNTETLATEQTGAEAIAQASVAGAQRPARQDAVAAVTHQIAQERRRAATARRVRRHRLPRRLASAARVPNLAQRGWRHDTSSIPRKLIDDVTKAPGRRARLHARSEPTPLVYQARRPVPPALAVGVPVGSYYQLYYVFPLTKDLPSCR